MTHTRHLVATALAATALLLSGCGSDATSDDAATPEASATTTPAPAATTEPTATATTPEPSEAPTTPATTGKLISYVDSEDVGVMIAQPSDTSKLTGAPADFKAFIAAELGRLSPDQGCTEKPQISVDQLDTGGWARGGTFVPQCGGSASLWAKDGGTWKEAWSGQSLVECSILQRYRFPSRIAGDQCSNGSDAVPYRG
ncbi:hypothetical protein [Aeromicrobium fastidiosum]|uniref:Secreted protein n=1 Tax=Aeromicrobium fastidiosum TaxID=52699 RepID=A0A641APG3_9ACTN|nr:hypothetical protein [Aeromicrobium fastidiosum]KAA1378287.1 hypothetical protein ESP62_007890 [Aeromicrobium fastidiosum]MBP2388894.1 ABC-type amino acid transport substrate-binding protein [Aeromicrobium fastidiosum]